MFATVAGLRSADPAARELLASVDASRLEVLWRLRLPSALPSLLAAARYVVGLALAAAYYGEGGNLTHEGSARSAGGRPAARTPTCCGRRSSPPSLLGVVGPRRWSRCSSGSLLRWHVSQRDPGGRQPHGVDGRGRYCWHARTERTGRTFLLADRPGALAHIRPPSAPRSTP